MDIFEGESVILTCNSYTIPRWTRKDHEEISEGHYKVGNDLMLNHVEEKDSGWYYCKGTLSNSSMFTTSAPVQIVGKIYRVLIIIRNIPVAVNSLKIKD